MIIIIRRTARNKVPAIGAVLWNTSFEIFHKIRNLPNPIGGRFLIDSAK